MRLHDRIMNIPIASDFDYADFPNKVYAYKSGHRDARHAAAEMALIADELAESLETMTALCALKYGNIDADVYAEIEKANALVGKARGRI